MSGQPKQACLREKGPGAHPHGMPGMHIEVTIDRKRLCLSAWIQEKEVYDLGSCCTWSKGVREEEGHAALSKFMSQLAMTLHNACL